MTLQDDVMKAFYYLMYGLEPLKVIHHRIKFSSHRNCSSGDMMVLFYHLISKDHMIKRSCDFMGKTSSRQVTILQSLVAIATLVVEL